jgi:hypothetical protein
MMADADIQQYYWNNPIGVIDQNQWDVQHPEVQLQMAARTVYTPLIDWTDEPQRLGVMGTTVTELIEPDVNFDDIPFAATGIDAMGVDSRSRSYTVKRYAGAVNLNRKSNVFQQWQLPGGGRDWTPVLRGVLGQDVVMKHEFLARNIFLRSPKDRWTFAGGGSDFSDLTSSDTFDLDIVPDWNFRLGNTGSPVIPGDLASAKVAVIPPGVTYDIRKSLASAATNEAQMFRDAQLYAGRALNYELGMYSNVRFQEAPNNRFGINPAVLYNCGPITKQYGVTQRINAGDGAPDPETTKVDEVWSVGQKNVTHYLQLENFGDDEFDVNDIVTVHTRTTADFGVTGGVSPLDGTAVQRRIVAVDYSTNRISFDRPIMMKYDVPFVGTSQSGSTGTFYAYVTKARHVGMVLVMGARGGVLGAVAEPLAFYEPDPIDQFKLIWRFSYDMTLGHNVWEPNMFEVHFCAVSIPKPGGITGP